jgi:dihydroorotase
VSATKYDLIVKGGRVIDPSLNIDSIRDVAVAGGKIAAVEANIAPNGAAEVLDAQGKLVVPGLLDIHTHVRFKEMPATCLRDGVTGIVDAGSQGADQIEEVVAFAKAAPSLCRIFINIAKIGIVRGGELMDLKVADVAAARSAIERHRDVIIGVKVRLSEDIAGNADLEALKLAQEVAAPLNLPVMIHMGQTHSPMPKILALLKRGDLVSHMYAPDPNSILDQNGRLFPEVLEARRRGVWFDVANGRRGHIRWDVAERALDQGFVPDAITTDWTQEGAASQSLSMLNVMSKFLHLGMPLKEVIACATCKAARVFDAFRDRGTLNVGAPADIAVLELREGSFEFVDNYDNKRTGRQRLFPSATVLGGRRISAP